ncbi:branched chain amino acid/phenylalanine ABC transporter ATP binding subunit LivF [Gammaproteobacteria bacterium]
MNLLEVHGLTVHYGGIQAVTNVDLVVAEGEVACLIGANGAGKSTILRALAGLLTPTAGEISLWGKPITHLPCHERVRHGLALVPEGRGVFPRLTVEENLLMGGYLISDYDILKSGLDRAYQLFPRLGERLSQKAGTLSGGEQQMLAIARALMSRPKLLLLDEPSMGLAPILVRRIFDTLISIAQDGVTLLLVEQNARLALATSQRGYVLEGGAITLGDRADALLVNPRVKTAYLGADLGPGGFKLEVQQMN